MSPTNGVSPVSTAHGSGPRACVDDRGDGVLRPVPGSEICLDTHVAQLELPAVVACLLVTDEVRGAAEVLVDDRRKIIRHLRRAHAVTFVGDALGMPYEVAR
jgi:hypothetical protein